MSGLLLAKMWHCPRCPSSARTVDDKLPHHRCKGLAGLLVPLVLDGTTADVRPVERGDYVGREQVQTDADGRPWMATITTRDEGQDCTVYAPCAVAKAGED